MINKETNRGRNRIPENVSKNYGLASGGVISVVNGYVIHTFSGDGSFVAPVDMQVEILVIAGGGGGGAGRPGNFGNGGGGGGGAGGFVNQAYIVKAGVSITVVVGAGGDGGFNDNDATPSAEPTSGDDSSFGDITAKGGGESTNASNASAPGGFDGGSGGGAGRRLVTYTDNPGGLATQPDHSETGGFGSDGGSSDSVDGGGGGGGAFSKGADALSVIPGIGGTGKENDLSGAVVEYCKGGAGGHGTNTNIAGSDGDTPGSGGGGSSRITSSSSVYGGDGADGVVFIKYRELSN